MQKITHYDYNPTKNLTTIFFKDGSFDREVGDTRPVDKKAEKEQEATDKKAAKEQEAADKKAAKEEAKKGKA